mgnify:CR=1 FL=1
MVKPVCVVVVLALAVVAHGQYVVDTGVAAGPTNRSLYYNTNTDEGQFLAQQFSIGDTASIQSIDVYAFLNTATILATITTQIGPGTTVADELGEATLVVPDLPGSGWVSAPLDIDLPPGDYFLTLWTTNSITAVPTGAPNDVGPTYFSNNANLNSSYGPASTYVFDGARFGFRLAVPEPAGLALLAGTGPLVLARRRR